MLALGAEMYIKYQLTHFTDKMNNEDLERFLISSLMEKEYK